MTTEQNKAGARRWMAEGFNGRNLAEFDRYFGQDLVNHELPPNLPGGVEGTKMMASMFFSAFPDIVVEIENLLAEGDKVVIHWSATGTHRGSLMGIPPTGREIAITGIAIDRFAGSRSVEHWEIFDQLGMMQQLGVIPTSESAG